MKLRVILFIGFIFCLGGFFITVVTQILIKPTHTKASIQNAEVKTDINNVSTETVPSLNQIIQISHPSWKDKLTLAGNRICRSNGDCGNVRFYNNNELIEIKWDKWGKERFQKQGNKFNLLQTVSQKTIENEYAELEYSFEQPFIKLNPYGKTPLSAVIKFPTEKPAQITLTIKGKGKSPDISHTFDAWNTEHTIPVLGLYANYKNTVELTAKFKNGEIIKSVQRIKTPTISDYIPWFVLNKKDNSFNYYASYHGSIHDEEGALRYKFIENGWYHAYFMKNEIIVEHSNNLKRHDMLGKHLQTYTYPKNFYSYIHGMGQKPNGNFLIFGSYNGSMAKIENTMQETHRDFILEMDYKTGEILKTYDLAQLLNPDRSLVIKSSFRDYNKIDWAHTNGIDYDAENESIIVSGRHMGIAKISEKTGNLTWWMTIHQQTDKSGRNGDKGDITNKLLTAIDKNKNPYSNDVQKGIQAAPDFKWPLKTHSVKYAGNGVYSIFDNSGRVYDSRLKTSEDSVASIYKIDDKKKTVQQIFLKHLNAYSEVGSSVVVNPHNHKDIWVIATEVKHPEVTKYVSTYLWRFDAETGEEIYHAITPKGHHYLIHPYTFYKN